MRSVAIITRTKDRPLFLDRAFNSILRQTFRDFVWVVVNDGGTKDHVDAVVSQALCEGLDTVIIHHETSRGMEAASNVGVKACESEFIVIHDDDDTWEPTFLEKSVTFLRSDDGRRYGGVLTFTTTVNEKVGNGRIFTLRKEPFNDWMHAVYLVDVARANTFAPIAFLYRRSVYNRIGGYDESFPVLGDWKFNIQFLFDSDIGLIREPLANYHKRIDAKDAQLGNTITSGRYRHHEYDALFRNDLLRREAHDGKFGIGLLVNLVKENEGSDSLLSWQTFKRILRRSRLGWIVRYL
jgi:glycosyltransferase involved in cell wall biosynthesis